MTSTPTDPLLGQTIDGRYRIEARLARGGMATVYRATDLRLDRPVAVKILHPHLAEGPKFVDRFRREARAAARLLDPGIVAVYDQGTWGEAPYLVMELVDGPNLRALMLSSGLPSVGQALDFMIQVMHALAVAHAAGFVHRDIKPENILIGRDGRVKVADFGLARAVSEVTAASSGVVLGTVAYLSPELIAEGRAGPPADIYAAGVVLFELLTGAQPFVAEAPIQVAYQHVNADFPAPSSRVGWLPAEVDALVLALTAKDPARRPPDATAALGLLRSVRRAVPDAVAARAPGAPGFGPGPALGEEGDLPDAAGAAPGGAAAPGVGGPGAAPPVSAEAVGASPVGASPVGVDSVRVSPVAAEADGPGGATGADGSPPGAAAGGGGEGATDPVPTDRPGGRTGGTQALPLARIPPPARPPAGAAPPKARRRHRALVWVVAAVLVLG
ncbi:MAG: protein kinase, partial [Bifidobacteriaceae bacterium]|nr:protein kinase [Bifidobacteriaceae bacterium]